MTPGSWPSVALIYLHGVLGSASLSKIIPLQADFAAHVGTDATDFALLISLLTAPAAIFATVGGSIVDRVGARNTLIAVALAGAAANLLYLQADSIRGFELIRIFEGCVMIGVFAAAPALIMATTTDQRRGKAMAFWSTYTPVGVSLGLVMSGIFAGSEHWRGGYAVHCGLFVALAAASLLLPRPSSAAGPRPPLRLLATYAQRGPLRLALTFGALVIMGFGTSTVFPAWYAQQQQVSVGVASSILAVANLTMILGGVLTAVLVARGARRSALFLLIAVVSCIAGIGLYAPGTHSTLQLTALVVWLVTSGAATAVVTSSLPHVISNPGQGAAAAGLLSQIAAISTFVTPQIWLPILAGGNWMGFIAVIGGAWIAALILMPRVDRSGP